MKNPSCAVTERMTSERRSAISLATATLGGSVPSARLKPSLWEVSRSGLGVGHGRARGFVASSGRPRFARQRGENTETSRIGGGEFDCLADERVREVLIVAANFRVNVDNGCSAEGGDVASNAALMRGAGTEVKVVGASGGDV